MGSPVEVPKIKRPGDPDPIVDDDELSRLAEARRRREGLRVGREDLVITPADQPTTGVATEEPTTGTGGKTTGLRITS